MGTKVMHHTLIAGLDLLDELPFLPAGELFFFFFLFTFLLRLLLLRILLLLLLLPLIVEGKVSGWYDCTYLVQLM